MRRLFALILALCLMLCACGGEEATEPTTEATVASTETFPTEESTEPTEPPAPEDPAKINPLTGEALEEASNARPIAIMINNSKDALPHCGTGEADVVYETLVEGGMTRFMAIFTQPQNAAAIGSIRSCRPPFVGIVQAYDAIYSSASGDSSVLSMITNSGVDYINALYYDGNYYYRDSARLSAGYNFEHTLFIKGENLLKLAQDKGMRTNRKDDMTYGFTFAEDAAISGTEANTVKIFFQSGGKSTTVTYNEELGGYTLNQYGIDYIDGNTGKSVVFRNILVLEGTKTIMPNGVHVQMENVGEGAGYYLLDGQMIPINWSREHEDAPYVYTTTDGEVVNFGIGTTYVALIADGTALEVQ